MNPYPPSLPGVWGAVGFTEPPAPEYVHGLCDFAQICSMACRRSLFDQLFRRQSDRILIGDLNPPEFWQLVASAGCIEIASREIGPANVIIYLNQCDELEADHPIVRMVESKLVTVRRLMVDLPHGFRVLEKPDPLHSVVTLMKPNPEDERFPLIWRVEYADVGPALNRIRNDLAGGYMDWKR